MLGVTMAMEEQRANGAPIDDGAINGIKVGLMGPLAGVGDPIFWGTVRPVFAALGAGIAMSGSLLGPILFFVLFNLVRLLTRYYGVAYGYRKGGGYRQRHGRRLPAKTDGRGVHSRPVCYGRLGQQVDAREYPAGGVQDHRPDRAYQRHHGADHPRPADAGPGTAAADLRLYVAAAQKVNALWIIIGFFVIGIFGYWIGLLGL